MKSIKLDTNGKSLLVMVKNSPFWAGMFAQVFNENSNGGGWDVSTHVLTGTETIAIHEKHQDGGYMLAVRLVDLFMDLRSDGGNDFEITSNFKNEANKRAKENGARRIF